MVIPIAAHVHHWLYLYSTLQLIYASIDQEEGSIGGNKVVLNLKNALFISL